MKIHFILKKTGYAFTQDMNDAFVDKFNSAFSKITFYNPKNLIVQHLTVEEREKKIEIIRMRNGYIIDTLTRKDNQEIVKNGCKVIELYAGVIYREDFKVSILEMWYKKYLS